MSELTASGIVMTLADERWHALVEEAPDASIFHHPAWSGLLEECYGYRPFVAAVCDETGEIRAGVPVMEVASPLTGRRWISLPFTDHCRPLYRGAGGAVQVDLGEKDWSVALLEVLEDLRQDAGVASLELRTGFPPGAGVSLDESQVLHLLKLSPETEDVFDKFHRSQVQRNIRRAEREGIEVRRETGREGLDAFYALHLDTRRRLGVPVQPKRYFDLLQQRLLGTGLGFVLLAYSEGRPVAGAVFLTYKKTLTYKYGASRSDSWPLRPNHALFWTAIQWGCEQGFEVFDWGKTAADNDGLRRFKGHWGAEEFPLLYSVLGAEGQDGQHAAVPGRLSDIMEVIIRKSPPFVCRTVGELLYKHFA
jgi:CelD/BcsL family acetyltransferase involved in cellulose biosynthesis